VTVVVSAGNSADDLKRYIPATYPETIVVPALGDYDGLPGGRVRDDHVTIGAACRQQDGDALSVTESFYGPQGTAYEDDDDLLVVFNWPSSDEPHAIAAPGACIRSTWPGRRYRKESGTSMASPHVAGAAALYLATHPTATPAQVLAALRQAGEREVEGSPGTPTIPGALVRKHFDEQDRHGEPVVRAGGL
jgi:subtilisin family serine protease